MPFCIKGFVKGNVLISEFQTFILCNYCDRDEGYFLIEQCLPPYEEYYYLHRKLLIN